MKKIKLGVAPIKRSFLPMSAAKEQKDEFMLVIRSIKSDYIEIIDIDDICENGIAFEYNKVASIVDKFRKNDVDAIFLPFCDFGEESVAAGIAANFKVPVLVWGPRDTAPNTDLTRGRDTQCGIIAATKVLSRSGVKFSYIMNSPSYSRQFQQGFENFIRVTNVVKTMKHMRIAQIGQRPEPFMSVISNEGALLEKFGITAVPISLTQIAEIADRVVAENGMEFQRLYTDITTRIDCSAMKEETIQRVVGLRMAMQQSIENKDCVAASMECWTAAPLLRGVPCIAIGELTGAGIPVSCEGDLNGAVTLAIMNACAMGDTTQFFADLTIRHPENDNAELLWHCGPFPYALKDAASKARMVDFMGRWELKKGDITLCRFDDISGQYYLFAGAGHAIDGPETTGTYVWFETDNWKDWEERLVFGPYIHHVGGMYGNYSSVLREAARYLDVQFDEPGACGPKSL